MGQISQIGGNTLVDNVARQRLTEKQDILVSGETIKTINGISILGSGDLPAGLIDDIRINGVTIVANKIANIVVRSTLAADSNDLATITAIRDYVNSSINNLASYYITSDASGNAFSTKAALVAGPYYYAGSVRAVTKNDYAIVMADESHDNKSARYVYTDNQWAFQYTFQMSFTQAQLSALNSGITAAAIALYDAHLSNTSNPHSVTKSQVGLGNVANERQYSSTNPPPYPVTSVAGKTGAVSVTKTDVGLSNVGNFKAVSTVASQGLTDDEKKNARNNIGAYTKPSTGIPTSDLDPSVLSGKQDALTTGDGIIIDDYDEIRVDGNSTPVRSSWTTGAVPKKNANTGAWDEVQLGGLATKNTVSNSDISGTISDSHISSASKWDGKQDAIEVGNGLDANEFSEHGILNVSSEVISGAAAGATAIQTETDPTVPSWAKQPTKPTYTASEVGARPSTWTPTKTDVGLGNVDNKSEATIKNDFTGAIAPGNTGFVTGSDLFRSVPNRDSGWSDGAVPVYNDGKSQWGEVQLGGLATKSTVSNSDISGTISDAHIASASRWDGKQDAVTPGKGIDSYGFSEQGTLRVDDATVPYRESWSNNAVPVRNSSKDRWDEVQLGGLATKSTVAQTDLNTDLNTKIQNGSAAYQSVIAISNVIPDDATPSNMLVDQDSLDSQLPDTVNLVLNPLSDGTYNLTFTIS